MLKETANTLQVQVDSKPSIYGESLKRHRAFWQLDPMDRPLLGLNVGLFMSDRYPKTASALPKGVIRPKDIRTDLFIEDCERQFEMYKELGDDYVFVGSPFKFVPWMEAIMGCPILGSPSSLWTEPCVGDWESWHWERPTMDNPWAEKLLELMRALADHSRGRYPVSATLMRGASDVIAAMRGAIQLPLDSMDCPDRITQAVDLCMDLRIELSKAQQALIPYCPDGYMDGDNGLRYWCPGKPTWLQEDGLALLSPELYRDLFLQADLRYASEFPATAFHLHSIPIWALDDLLSAPEISVIQLGFDEGISDVEVEWIFEACRRVQGIKPLIIYRDYDEGFWECMDRIVSELPARGVSIQTNVRDVEQGKRVMARLLEMTE